MARTEIVARHPQNPTAKWEKFTAAQRQAAIRSAEHRAQEVRKEHGDALYARNAAHPPTKA